MVYFKLTSKFGDLIGCINGQAELVGLWFQDQKYFPVLSDEFNWLTDKKVADKSIYDTYSKVVDQLQAYERGTLKTFDIPLNPPRNPL